MISSNSGFTFVGTPTLCTSKSNPKFTRFRATRIKLKVHFLWLGVVYTGILPVRLTADSTDQKKTTGAVDVFGVYFCKKKHLQL